MESASSSDVSYLFSEHFKHVASTKNNVFLPPGGGEWIISVGDYVNNSFAALGSSDPREVRLEL